MQDCSISIANTQQILQSCTKPSRCKTSVGLARLEYMSPLPDCGVARIICWSPRPDRIMEFSPQLHRRPSWINAPIHCSPLNSIKSGLKCKSELRYVLSKALGVLQIWMLYISVRHVVWMFSRRHSFAILHSPTVTSSTPMIAKPLYRHYNFVWYEKDNFGSGSNHNANIYLKKKKTSFWVKIHGKIMDANSSYPDWLPNNFQCGKYSIASGTWFYKIIINCYFPVCSISISRITFHETCFVSNHKCNGSECCCKNIFHVVIVCVNFPWMINPGRLLSILHYFLFHCTNLFAFPYFFFF